jgi:hypothetical protein
VAGAAAEAAAWAAETAWATEAAACAAEAAAGVAANKNNKKMLLKILNYGVKLLNDVSALAK